VILYRKYTEVREDGGTAGGLGDAVWNQGGVRAGEVVAGYWAVNVRRAGRY
jgi:hypothetical protein